jgi:hypothetical protein
MDADCRSTEIFAYPNCNQQTGNPYILNAALIRDRLLPAQASMWRVGYLGIPNLPKTAMVLSSHASEIVSDD